MVATLRGSRVYRVNSSRSGGIVIILNFDKVHSCPGPQRRRRMTSTDLFAALHHAAIGTPFCSTPFYTPNGAVCEQYKCRHQFDTALPLVLLDCITTPAQSAISIKMQIAVVLYQDRRASTPLTADSRKTAVTITLGLNDEFPLQEDALEHLLEDAVLWGLTGWWVLSKSVTTPL